jgi:hypothetical protein
MAKPLRTVDRGRPLEDAVRAALPPDRQQLDELVKGSLDYAMAMIRTAFYRQFRSSSIYDDRGPYVYIEEIFDGYVVVRAEDLPPDEYYYVPYSRDEQGAISFTPRDQWEVVELAYRIQAAVSEQARKLAGMLLAEQAPPRQATPERRRVEIVETLTEVRLDEADAKTGARRITGYGITADTVNKNGRRYSRAVLDIALAEARTNRTQLGARAVLGESGHPSDKGQRAEFLETIVRWDDWVIEADGRTKVTGIIVPTSKGRDAITLMEHEVFPGLSQRAWGYADLVTVNGQKVEEITELHISGYDLVLEPSDPNGAVTMLESRRSSAASAPTPTPTPTSRKEARPVEDDQLTLEALKERYPDQVKAILAEADANRAEAAHKRLQEQARLDAIRDEARKQALDEANKQHAQELATVRAEKAQLEEAEQRRKVNDHIAVVVNKIDAYNGKTKAQLVEDVQADSPKTVEEAEALIARRRKTLDAALAQRELGSLGLPQGNVQVTGPVIESATGHPEFAKPALELTEALVRTNHFEPRPHLMSAPKTKNERFAAEMLKRFDAENRHILIQEARHWNEAETTADLSLPYTVARTIMAEAIPMLVAPSIFDVQTTESNPTKIYYEYYEPETGSVPSIVDEVLVADHGAWVSLANKVLRFGTVVVTNAANSTTYGEGTDYVIDYIEGRVMALATGTITDGQSLRVDYTYDAIRRGEMAAIKRGKQTLLSKTLEIHANRLAGQISREAVVFSRSQLNYDATTRMLAGLTRRIAEAIDKGILLRGLASVLSVAGNSGGTWTSASDSLAKLEEYIGFAKVKVANRFYEPQFVLMSMANADRLSNSDRFTNNGQRADASLDGATGMVGRIKGLPVFNTTQFPDSYILVGNRELVQHRIYQAMVLRGPFPTYSSDGELIAADQYYAEQFDGTDSHLPEKGSYIKVA